MIALQTGCAQAHSNLTEIAGIEGSEGTGTVAAQTCVNTRSKIST